MIVSPFFWLFVIAAAHAGFQAPSEDPHFLRGLELQNSGKMELAIKEYELSLKAHPSFPVLANLGAAYAGLGRYQEAVSRYELFSASCSMG